MMLVKGGPANSGTKRPLREPHGFAWKCSQEHLNPSYATRCLTTGCNEKRP